MAWSLGAHMAAPSVEALLDTEKDAYPPEQARSMPRETAMAVVSAALWAYGTRAGSTSGAYAYMNLYEALGLKMWSFDEEEAAFLQEARNEFRRRKAAEAKAARDAAADAPAAGDANDAIEAWLRNGPATGTPEGAGDGA